MARLGKETRLSMTADEFNAALAQLGLTYDSAAPVLGIGRRSIARYGKSQAAIPQYVDRLVTLLQKRGIPKEWRE